MTDNLTCRGSYALGTACGRCSRCKAEKDRYYASMEVDAALNTPSISLRKIREAEARGYARGLREALHVADILAKEQQAEFDAYRSDGQGKACRLWAYQTARQVYDKLALIPATAPTKT